jgi:hypothetical protein
LYNAKTAGNDYLSIVLMVATRKHLRRYSEALAMKAKPVRLRVRTDTGSVVTVSMEEEEWKKWMKGRLKHKHHYMFIYNWVHESDATNRLLMTHALPAAREEKEVGSGSSELSALTSLSELSRELTALGSVLDEDTGDGDHSSGGTNAGGDDDDGGGGTGEDGWAPEDAETGSKRAAHPICSTDSLHPAGSAAKRQKTDQPEHGGNQREHAVWFNIFRRASPSTPQTDWQMLTSIGRGSAGLPMGSCASCTRDKLVEVVKKVLAVNIARGKLGAEGERAGRILKAFDNHGVSVWVGDCKEWVEIGKARKGEGRDESGDEEDDDEFFQSWRSDHGVDMVVPGCTYGVVLTPEESAGL